MSKFEFKDYVLVDDKTPAIFVAETPEGIVVSDKRDQLQFIPNDVSVTLYKPKYGEKVILVKETIVQICIYNPECESFNMETIPYISDRHLIEIIKSNVINE